MDLLRRRHGWAQYGALIKWQQSGYARGMAAAAVPEEQSK